MAKAIFLDRDNTINYDPGYLGDPHKVKIFDGVIEVLKYFKEFHDFLIIIISNQAGIAKGFLTHEMVNSVNNKISDIFKEKSLLIDKFYYCPFHPEYNSEEESSCRKPSPKMILEASKEFKIDLSISYIIGDSESDIEAGISAGLNKNILYKYNLNDSEIKNIYTKADFCSNNYFQIKNYILSQIL